jgi:translation elongation factor EF-G
LEGTGLAFFLSTFAILFANFLKKVIKGIRAKLGLNCAAVQIPIGLQNGHEGVIDLIERRAIYFEGAKGEQIEYMEAPERMKPVMEEKRQALLEAIAEFDEAIMEKLLEVFFLTRVTKFVRSWKCLFILFY